MKTLIQIDNGEILRMVTTNDDNFELNNPGNYIDIEDYENKNKITEKPYYYKILRGEIIEKSEIEKSKKDNEINALKPSPNSLEERFNQLENKIKDMEKKIK